MKSGESYATVSSMNFRKIKSDTFLLLVWKS